MNKNNTLIKILLVVLVVCVLGCAVFYTMHYGTKAENTGVYSDETSNEFDNAFVITEGGSYELSGEVNGRIKIEAGENDEVELVLNNAVITCTDTACIREAGAKSVTITLAEGSENYLYSLASDENDGTGSVIHTDADLSINGSGALTLYGYANNGIHCEQDFTLESGTLTVYAAGDCVQAENDISANGGVINLYTIGISDYTELESNSGNGEFSFENIDNMGSSFSKPGMGGMGNMGGFGNFDAYTSSSDGSLKGLKAGGALNISGGEINITVDDDALHAAGEITISGGVLTLASSDDGIHSDTSIVYDNAETVILCSKEGIEAKTITVNSGSISLASSDDGFNASGSGFGTSLPSLTINGGYVYVNADGDGLDSNGNLIINGGTVIVDGPSTSANGALDSGTESGGSILVNGGTLLAIGASGMAESPESDSEQYYVDASVTFSSGSKIVITDADRNVLLAHTTAESGSSLIFSCPELTDGQTVTITVDGTSTTATAGKSESNGMGGFGNFGGRRK